MINGPDSMMLEVPNVGHRLLSAVVVVTNRPNLRSLQNSDNNNNSSNNSNGNGNAAAVGPFIVFFFLFIVMCACLAALRGCHRASRESIMTPSVRTRANTNSASIASTTGARHAHGQQLPEQANPNSENDDASKMRERQKIEQKLVTRHYTEEEDSNHTDCSICLSSFEKGDEVAQSVNSECTHLFHTECIVNWLITHQACPECRRDFLSASA